MRLRTLVLPAFALSLLVAGCSDDDPRGTGGTGGTGASTSSSSSASGASSSSSSTSTGAQGGEGGAGPGGAGPGGAGPGGAGPGGAGPGGAGPGGAGPGGAGPGGAGPGGAGPGGAGGQGGAGGAPPLTENCGNTFDDDNDNDIDCADSDCAQAAVCGDLVINEVDYDQPGADDFEFVEILNKGAGPVSLDGLSLYSVNGSNSTSAGRVALNGLLLAGQYLVVGDPLVVSDPAAAFIELVELDDMGMPTAVSLQNGAPDGVALHDETTGELIDSLSYEGAINAFPIGANTFDLVHGTATTAVDVDSGDQSLVRTPNGASTGNDSVDWVSTNTPTPGAANTVLAAEICDNGMDENNNGQIDCAEASCDAQTCDGLGFVCAGGACVCPGGIVETTCGDAADNDCDADIDCADTDCAADPACITAGVNAVDYPVIAHGGKLVISGVGFTGTTGVTIGGEAQAFVVDSDVQITVAAVTDATPIAAQDLVLTGPGGSTGPFSVTVIDLVISETDADTDLTDVLEFVEIATGVPNVSLAGYVLVLYNGSNDLSYFALNLAATTDAEGRLLIGNVGVVPAPALTFSNDFLQNGPDGVGLHQGAAATFPNGTPVTATSLIDAVVYDTADADDTGLMSVLYTTVPNGQFQVDEGGMGVGPLQSVQRCFGGRRNGNSFTSVQPPTPGAANTCL